jgi:malate dehydrogenase (oxaloacetate-decarboxylating)
MPVFHDDQHGTAIVVAAALLNGCKIRGDCRMGDLRVTINGAGAAGIAVTKLLLSLGVGDVVLCDRAGAIFEGRGEHMDFSKEEIARLTNRERRGGSLGEVIAGSDVIIGLSAGGVLTPQMVRQMAPNPLVFALANPVPEITPDLAREAGALAVATGRSDYPNQVNNSLAFPGVFRGALDVKARTIDDDMKIAAARAIAELVDSAELSPDFLIPDSLDLRVAPRVAAAVAAAAIANGLARNPIEPRLVEQRTRDLVYEGSVGL